MNEQTNYWWKQKSVMCACRSIFLQTDEFEQHLPKCVLLVGREGLYELNYPGLVPVLHVEIADRDRLEAMGAVRLLPRTVELDARGTRIMYRSWYTLPVIAAIFAATSVMAASDVRAECCRRVLVDPEAGKALLTLLQSSPPDQHWAIVCQFSNGLWRS